MGNSLSHLWSQLMHKTACLAGILVLKTLTYLIWPPHPSSSVAQLPVDKPALAWIMTHDYAEDLCAFELGLLRIQALEVLLID